MQPETARMADNTKGDDDVSYTLIWRTSNGDVIGTGSFINQEGCEQKVRSLLDEDPDLVFEHGTVASRNNHSAFHRPHR